jgi:hypothetical protein
MECRIHQKETVGCGMQDTLKAYVSVAIYVEGNTASLSSPTKLYGLGLGGDQGGGGGRGE